MILEAIYNAILLIIDLFRTIFFEKDKKTKGEVIIFYLALFGPAAILAILIYAIAI